METNIKKINVQDLKICINIYAFILFIMINTIEFKTNNKFIVIYQSQVSQLKNIDFIWIIAYICYLLIYLLIFINNI